MGANVFWRRVAHLAVVFAVVTAAGGGLFAASASAVSTSGQLSKGMVDLSRVTGDDGESSVYTVHFRGPISDHGWAYNGQLTAVGATWSWTASLSSTPILSVTPDDGTVTGTCAGASDTADLVTTSAFDMTFGCVLSRSGSTPWQITLRAALSQDATDPALWTGDYVESETTSQVNVPGDLTYGEAQLGNRSSVGYPSYGPLRLSGQISIGGTLYRGDLVSGTSDFIASNDIPPLSISGSGNGVTVSGTCSGTYDETLAQAGLSSYDFSCSLAVGGAPPAAVSFKTVFTSGTGTCSYRDCWGDSAGYFT